MVKTVFGATLSSSASYGAPAVVKQTTTQAPPSPKPTILSSSKSAPSKAGGGSSSPITESLNQTPLQRVATVLNPMTYFNNNVGIALNNPFTGKQIASDVKPFLAPVVIGSEIGGLVYGGAVASSAGLFSSATAPAVSNIGKTALVASGLFGAGILASGLFSSGSPATTAPQNVTQTPTQPTTGTQTTTSTFYDYSNKNQYTYNQIYGSPNASISSSQAIPTSQNTSPIFSQNPTQTTGASQSQEASTAGTNWALMALIGIGAYYFVSKR
jgi:hypothetical protein